MNNNYYGPTSRNTGRRKRGSKGLLCLAAMLFALLLPASLKATPQNGSTYFRNASNYDAYSLGRGRIHFRVLVFADGVEHNFNAGRGGSGSRIWTHVDGADSWPNFVYYASDNLKCKAGAVPGRPRDKGWAELKVARGIVVVTNSYDGSNPVFTADDNWHPVDLRRTDGNDHLTYLEFDWYIPDSIQSGVFQCGIESVYHESGGTTCETRLFPVGYFDGGEQQPQLMNPIFYTANYNGVSSYGVAGYGMLAVPYVAFQQTYQYHTAWSPVNIPCTDQSGLIYVPSCDSVQTGFHITMQTRHSMSTGDTVRKQWLRSNMVDIPAYHKIYDMDVEYYTYFDERSNLYHQDRRYYDISWKFQLPNETDIVPNDLFEIQRAYDSNYTDAQTIATIPIVWGVGDSLLDTTYHYIDSSEATLNNPLETGNNKKIYYRVRRASAAVWGWDDHPYAAKSWVFIRAEMPYMMEMYYRIDDDFFNNHKTHLYFEMPNGFWGDGTPERPRTTSFYWDKHATVCIERILNETHDTVRIRVPADSVIAVLDYYHLHPVYDTFHDGTPILHVVDVLNTPCVHYRYRYYYDTTGMALPMLPYGIDNTIPRVIYLRGNVAPYFTDAAGLNTLAASYQEYPDHVLLTWSATEGGVDDYLVETRADSTENWRELGTTTYNYWRDQTADPSVSAEWQYRVTMRYTCQGVTTSDSRQTVGARSPWGRVSGRVHYEDGSACPNITVVATRSDSTVVQTVVTDNSGFYQFDSLPYSSNQEYVITPTSQHATFQYNNTASGSATVNLSLNRCLVTDINFENISAVRLTGRVLYENSSIPVRDANLMLNGNIVRLANSALKTDASGYFELQVPQRSGFTLQVVKEGHHFAEGGFVRIDGDSVLTLETPLDGVRLWDQTKVRLAGRVAGGLLQRQLPLGFGESNNNLGDNLKLVLELEGDNVSYIVRIPSDLTRDTLDYTVPHLVYNGTNAPDTTGFTNVHYQLRRIVIEPDPATGEYCADLFPVRYKVIQATAQGYSTLFAHGRSSETIDLSNAAGSQDTVRHQSNNHYTLHNAEYQLTYRSPINITCKQLRYGMELDYFGELFLQRTNIQNTPINVPLATQDSNGTYHYLFGAPVFLTGNYDFRAYAHEDYYYNNDPDGEHDQVRIQGGTLKVYNGMHDATNTQIITKELDSLGQAVFSIPVDYVSFVRDDENVRRVRDLSVESEGEYVELQALRGYVTGHRVAGTGTVTSSHGAIKLLDVLRDPPGSGSSAFVEAGSEYSYSYTSTFDFKFGINLGFTFGSQASVVMGAYIGVGGGTFAGQNFNINSSTSFAVPVHSAYHYKHEGNYTFKTTERISTSNSPYNVGQDADVYIGAVQNVYYRLADAVQPIDSVTYAALAARSANGSMHTIAQGVDNNGKRYYLVIGNEIEAGPYLSSTFAYTHSHIVNNIIPQLQQQRDELLLTCDSATAKSIANAQQKVVYWSRVTPDDTNWARLGSYKMVYPDFDTLIRVNEVQNFNRTITDWISLLLMNEAEKVSAIHNHSHDIVATHSISSGATVSTTNNYSYSDAFHVYMEYPGFSIGASNLSNIGSWFGNAVRDLMLEKYANVMLQSHDGNDNSYDPVRFISNWAGSHFDFTLKPILDFNWNRDPTQKTTHTRTIGYSLVPDAYSNMDVSVYRIRKEKGEFYLFNQESGETRNHVANGNDYHNEYLYGSLVYYLQGGATKCPCEVADSTHYYVPQMPISAGSLKLENPKVDIDVHERSNVPADRPAMFTIYLSNEVEATTGPGATAAIQFKLKMNDLSNPHGARVYIDGMPLTDGRTITLTRGQVVVKTMEVYAGDGYDFDDLVIELGSTCISSAKGKAQFSVHFVPVSCNVNITSPHDGWVMNTLSPKDSVGYYLPVTINDYDVNYRGFDHIELQYKLSTQSDDGWVNLCSYYADSALYKAASGTKAMIMGGSIENIRFYGDRDPIEQRYDLRAVSFCRHGSGFISRSSEVLSGIKDTRCPRVFGEPLPANSILGVGDYCRLRFNEPIAGNYLDEDNNFQLLGVTNRSGIASSTSVYFDGTPNCDATSAVTRVLSAKSFSIDMMVKPDAPVSNRPQELFGHTTKNGGISFGLMPDGNRYRLYGTIDDYTVQSLPLEPMTAFTRVVMTYNNITNEVQFYAGTQNVTDPSSDMLEAPSYTGSAPLTFGHGYKGNMLEARLWLKAISADEIVETHLKRLTGYERKLAAYYPMNEGRGEILYDIANGSALTMHGANWTTPSGYSIRMNGTQTVTLDQDVLSRSAIQDYTLMFWFRTTEYYTGLFSAGWTGQKGTLVSIENGRVVFHNNGMTQQTSDRYADGLWHHYVLTVNRTYNNASIYIDGEMVNTFATDTLSGLSGVMVLGGDAYGLTRTFTGNIDDLALFEQALPRSLIETFDNISPFGDEMGLVGLLTFSEQRENSSSIMEEVFSVNNRRIFRATSGTVVNKIQPLVIAPDSATLASMADRNIHAPVRERDLLTKINFDWSFNNDELLININMPDREINKNNIYLTVRNVEDMNGNRTVSPIMWQVYVNKNTLIWDSEGINEVFYDRAATDYVIPVQIRNTSGRRHQYYIDGEPDWLGVSPGFGSIDPQESLTLQLVLDKDLPIGTYAEIIYLTDENGLAEPLKVYVQVKAKCPWPTLNIRDFDHQMSFRGQVVVDGIYDTNPEDIVAAIIDDRIVGQCNISFDEETNASYVYMTIYGNDDSQSQPVSFRLWESSTGRIFSLSSSEPVVFQSDAMAGLPPSSPVILSTTANEVQNLNLTSGWNWISFNIIPDQEGALDNLFFTNEPFSAGDQIKSASAMQFSEYDGAHWVGSLSNANYKQTYMIHTDKDHYNTQVVGRRIATDTERTVQLSHGWNSMPYLLTYEDNITNALADYIDHASVGDIVKSQHSFAVFSENRRWEGSLSALYPGEGYLLKRVGTDPVSFTYHHNNYNYKGGSKSGGKGATASGFSSSHSTNMTMIAAVEHPAQCARVLTYVGASLSAVTPSQVVDGDTLFFITIGSDQSGQVSFVLEQEDGLTGIASTRIPYQPNAHFGSLGNPVMLALEPSDESSHAVVALPSIFSDRVVFAVTDTHAPLDAPMSIRIFSVQGVQVAELEGTAPQLLWTDCAALPNGVYFASINYNGTVTTLKLIKK